MIKNTILRRWRLYLFFTFFASFNFVSAQYGPTDDFDGDGIINSIDIDDDNDGVPDAVESPSCYYTANEWNTLAKPAVGVSIASDLTTVSGLGNFTALGDNNNTVSAVQFVTTPAQTQNNQALFTMTFTLPVQLDAFYIKKSSTTQISGGNLMFEASNDAVTWTPLFSAANNPANTATGTTANGGVALTNFNKFSVAQNAGRYKYYRIRGTTANNVLAGIATEFYFDFNTTAYVASMFAKATCTDANIDGDNVLPQFDLDTDGDGASDALEAGATTSTTPSFQFPDIDANNDGLVDAVDANNDGKVDYVSTYNPNALNNQISPFLAEICNDGLDNDLDGYIDGFDSDCGATVPTCIADANDNSVFSIIRSQSSDKLNANSVSPVVGDLDGDGMPEIIVASASPNAVGYRIYKGDGSDFSDNTIDVALNLTTVVSFPVYMPAIADINKDGFAEIIAAGADGFLHVFSHTGAPLFNSSAQIGYGTSNALTGSPRIHDINEDGIPEVICGNAVFTFNSTFTALNRVVAANDNLPDGSVISQEWDKDPVVIDILPQYPGKEIVAGGVIYTIDFVNGTRTIVKNLTDILPSWAANTDGSCAVADMDLDGDLDVVITSNYTNKIVIWDPNGNQVLKDITNIAGGFRGMPVIAEISDDIALGGKPQNYPEVVFLAAGNIYCINVQYPNPLWMLATSDGSSTTAISAFDFNGDGIKELVYRDQSTLRVFNGNIVSGLPSVLASFVSGSGTWAECPVIADVDNDGEAEIIVVSEHTATGQNTGLGFLDIYDAGPGTRWVDAPNYWNQREYRYTNINKDLTVPIQEQKINVPFPSGSSKFPLNISNVQVNEESLLTPQGQIASPDISVSGASITNLMADGSVNCSNVQVQYQIINTGSAAMASNIYVYVYDKDPRTQTTANLIYQKTTTQNIPVGSTVTQNLQFGIPAASLPASNLYIVLNSNPNMTVLVDQTDFAGSYPECDYSNNIFTLALPVCSDIDGDGVSDSIDIDDDNDGIVDALESPACFYTASEMATPNAVTSQISTTESISNLYDNNAATTFAFTATTGVNALNKGIFEIVPPSPIAANAIVLNLNTATSPLAALNATTTLRAEGWNGVSWISLATYTASPAIVNNVQTFAFTNTTVYSKYRLFESGTTGVAIAANAIQEVKLGIPANYVASAHQKPINCTVDTDNDGIPNHQDLDSDGDGCPDALEAGVSVNAGAFSSMSASGGSIYTGGIPSGTANAYVGNGTPSQYGANGFFNGIETALDSGIYNGTYTYSLYALSLGQNVCTDTDGDNVPDIFDIDDDNDGVLDKIECPTLFTNMATGGGFSAEAATLPNWYVGLASATFPIAEPFTPSVINISNNGNVYNYGIGGGNQVNSQLTGGLFDSLDGSNTATGVQYVLQEGDPQHPIVNKLSTPLVAGVPYNYSFDLGNRASGSATKYIVMLYNADTKMAEKIITSGALNTIPAVGATPSYKNFTGSFIPASSANYYLLFYPSVSGNTESDFVIDRVAVAGAGAGACDIDNDGIPNYLDLDSDGDGCPDTKEAILYNHATEASIAGDVKNGSGGVVTSTVNTPNAMVPGPYGNNGFADALQSASNPDAYKYVYTYLFVATDANVSTCDNKFLYDIDSDDDGIPDAVESPSCFYTEAQAMDITEGVTSDFGWTIANPLSKTYDDITLATNYGEISAPTATSIQNKALITFDLPVIDAAFINSITLNVGLSFGAGKWKLQGLNMMTNVWTDLSAAAGQALGAGTIVFNNTLQNNTRYHSYRIIGVDNINIANAARLIEFSIQYKNYNASYHRTKMGCSSDADGDGVPNYIDRDSDGDGCPDALEAGISKSLLVPGSFFNTGGQVMGDYVTVGGNYGDNGLGDSVETAPDSGIVNYTSTYTQYATNKTLNFCTDTDGDSVPDLIDLDDDNDGILDTAECTYPALPTTTSTADIFAIWSNTTTAAGTNGAPTYLTSVGSWTAGAGLTAAISGGVINISNVNGSTLGDAFGANEYLEHPFTTTADNYNSLYYIRSSASNATNYHWAMLISDDNFVTYTILNIDMLRNATGVAINDINDYQLKPSTAYKVRTYYWGAPAFTFDEFTMFGYSECDTDSDGVPNRLDLDSDGDGCPDAKESGVAANSGATASMSSSGGSIYTGGIASGTAEAYVGNGTPAQYGNNGFFNGIETAAESGLYNGTYTYASAINATISACFCYKTPAAGTGLDTHHGITSLQRAGTDNSNWPMVRKGAWTALESKTLAFVPNRLTIAEINNIPVANLKEGMMVYNITSNCIYINTDGTATGWKCFNTQACP
ncbi:FG-GAP-like repeat-containing protein [Chryseobacterium sp. LC2016-27]|uniref:FG-GAP repeat domain-containing protein n=1 Tax=Chryseobacterium sp. LC2016-27 TaxID=2897326 RepID=UPI001E37FB28|nr:VCBS repeat-containing protein [Chryseobacterium sp. LC2016-27]MCD0454775.1 FG-GAP-like repeat-containing protein [Chryseobacterium sp. LC2016-27]